MLTEALHTDGTNCTKKLVQTSNELRQRDQASELERDPEQEALCKEGA